MLCRMRTLVIAGMGYDPSIYVHERLEEGTELKKCSNLSEITVPVGPKYYF